MPYGVTPTGYIPRTFDEIVTSIAERLRAEYGELDTSPQGILGTMIAAIGNALANTEQTGLGTYWSQWIQTAEGVSLEYLGLFFGLEKQRQSSAVAYCAVSGVIGVGVVLESSQVAKTSNGAVFNSNGQYAISNSNLVRTTVTLSASGSGDFIVTLDGTAYSTSLTDLGDAVAALVLLINNTDNGLTAVDNLDDESFLVHSNYRVSFTAAATARCTLSDQECLAVFTAAVGGEQTVPIDSITTIITPQFGWTGVTNYVEGVPGRNEETDTEFRQRLIQARRVGRATPEAIKVGLLDVPGVTAVLVYENRTMNEVDGRPPKSYECVVVGGDDTAIAEAIYAYGPAGIETFGTEIVPIDDVNGDLIVIRFSRVTPVVIYLEAELTLSDEELFPVDGISRVTTALLDFFESNFGPGDDVLFQEVYTPIYSVPGIASVDLFIGTSTPIPPPGNVNISIDPAEYASLVAANITITIAP